jgi:hypothetical protein
MQQGFDSSYSDYGILDDLSAFQCAEDKSLPSVDPSSALCDNQFNDTYLFSEQKNVNAYGEQASQLFPFFFLLYSLTQYLFSTFVNSCISFVHNRYTKRM